MKTFFGIVLSFLICANAFAYDVGSSSDKAPADFRIKGFCTVYSAQAVSIFDATKKGFDKSDIYDQYNNVVDAYQVVSPNSYHQLIEDTIILASTNPSKWGHNDAEVRRSSYQACYNAEIHPQQD